MLAKFERQRRVSSFQVKREKKTNNFSNDDEMRPTKYSTSSFTIYLMSTSPSLYHRASHVFVLLQLRNWYRKVIFDRSNFDEAERNLFFRADARRREVEMRSLTTIVSRVSAPPLVSCHLVSLPFEGNCQRGEERREE